MFAKMRKSKKGFTLIELIVVIAILGILALIAVPRLGGFRDSANEAKDEANAKVIADAVSMYNVSHTLDERVANGSKLTDNESKLGDLVNTNLKFESKKYKGTTGTPVITYVNEGTSSSAIVIVQEVSGSTPTTEVFRLSY